MLYCIARLQPIAAYCLFYSRLMLMYDFLNLIISGIVDHNSNEVKLMVSQWNTQLHFFWVLVQNPSHSSSWSVLLHWCCLLLKDIIVIRNVLDSSFLRYCRKITYVGFSCWAKKNFHNWQGAQQELWNRMWTLYKRTPNEHANIKYLSKIWPCGNRYLLLRQSKTLL